MKIAQVEVRTEDDPDVAPYVCQRQIEVVKCHDSKPATLTQIIRTEIVNAMEIPMNILRVNNLLLTTNANFLVITMIDELIR